MRTRWKASSPIHSRVRGLQLIDCLLFALALR
jgi:hypothetical protein